MVLEGSEVSGSHTGNHGDLQRVVVAFVIGGSAMAIRASPCCCSIHFPTVITQSQWLVVVLEGTGVSGGHNNNKDLQNGDDELSSPCHSGGGEQHWSCTLVKLDYISSSVAFPAQIGLSVKSRSSPGQSLDEFWIRGMRMGEQRLT